MDIAQLETRQSKAAEDAAAQRETLLAPDEAGYFALAWRRLRRDRRFVAVRIRST